MVWPALVCDIEPGDDVRSRTVRTTHATTLLQCASDHLGPAHGTPYEDDGLATHGGYTLAGIRDAHESIW